MISEYPPRVPQNMPDLERAIALLGEAAQAADVAGPRGAGRGACRNESRPVSPGASALCVWR